MPIYGDMAAELSMAISVAQAAKCKYIVQDQGKRIIDFEKAWKTACEMAGVPKALFHDLRRTALTTRRATQKRKRWRSAGTKREPFSTDITLSAVSA